MPWQSEDRVNVSTDTVFEAVQKLRNDVDDLYAKQNRLRRLDINTTEPIDIEENCVWTKKLVNGNRVLMIYENGSSTPVTLDGGKSTEIGQGIGGLLAVDVASVNANDELGKSRTIYCRGGNTQNLPVPSFVGNLKTVSSASGCWQEACCDTNGLIYTRNHYGGSWRAWQSGNGNSGGVILRRLP